MKRIECNEPEDLQEWYSKTEPKLSNQKKLLQNLNKSINQINQMTDSLSNALADTINIFDQLTQINPEGFISDITRNANNKLKAFKGTLMDVCCTFTNATELLKVAEKSIFPLISQIKKTMIDCGTKKNIDACALCSIQAYEFMETTLIDIYSISINISIDLNRLTAIEKYTVEELRSMKEFTVPQLTYDLKNKIKHATIPISNQSLQTLIEHEGLSLYELPFQIHKIFYFLYTVGYSSTGIFRLAGRADTVALYAKYPLLIEYEEKNSIVIAATLKKFMRDLPEPIFPSSAYKEIIEATREYDQQMVDNIQTLKPVYIQMNENPHINIMQEESTPLMIYLCKLKKILSELPIASTVLHYFIELAVKIANGPSLMTPNNLAICLAPCILYDSKADITETGYCTMAIQTLIEHFKYVFNTQKVIYTMSHKNNVNSMKKRRATLISGKEKHEFIETLGSIKTISPPVEIIVNDTSSRINQPKIKSDISLNIPPPPPRPQQLVNKVYANSSSKKIHKKKIINLSTTTDDILGNEIKRKPLVPSKSPKAKTMKEQPALTKSCPTGEWNSLIEEMALKRKQMIERKQNEVKN
ncbi:rhogap domain containing protein [Entamoeba histolytica]|uniref:Rhogap domain containing protein n=1 Tax=Entamoeba histolytica TaxID=5759 RepID=A0A175JHP3_ENTHI|nr:rhogap domain containing protein [Entamoeba histolytica]